MQFITDQEIKPTEAQLKAINRLSQELGPATVLSVLQLHHWLGPIDRLSKGQAGIVLRDLHTIKELQC